MLSHSNSSDNTNPFASYDTDQEHCDKSEIEEHW